MAVTSALPLAYDDAAEARHVALRGEFLLDPDVVFLNHGSFGACPRPVFERYQEWQLELEQQPVEFIGRRRVDLLRKARTALAAYLNADPDEVVYASNVTHALNIAARSPPLDEGGNCHKWLCSPKGAGFLYARREVQHLLEPVIISWGWEARDPSGSRFIDENEFQGTRDFAASLAVPDAIQFQAQHDWPRVRDECH